MDGAGPMSELPGLKPQLQSATEREMLDALHDRYSQASQGASVRYACAEHVRSSASFDAKRVCDFMAQDLWNTGGLALHGHEVKVSRSDWLRELADPSKAQAFSRYCDRWWLVVPDAKIVRDDLPDGWGLMAFGTNGRLRVIHRAARLDPDPHPPTFRAALMRAVAKTNARRGSVIAQEAKRADEWEQRYYRLVENVRATR